MDVHAEAPGHLAQQLQHALMVGGVGKDLRAVVAALDDVVRQGRKGQAGQTSHGLARDGAKVHIIPAS
ncbi:hypothetical protein D3C78_1517390 [compost metagenome]